MKRTFSKLLAVLLTIAMVMSVIGVTALATSADDLSLYADTKMVEITFPSDALTSYTADQATVTVAGNGSTITGTASISGDKLIYTFDTPIAVGTKYSISIASGFGGLAEAYNKTFILNAIVNAKEDGFSVEKTFDVNTYVGSNGDLAPRYLFDDETDTFYYELGKNIAASKKQYDFGDYLVTKSSLGLANAGRYSISFKSKVHTMNFNESDVNPYAFGFYVNATDASSSDGTFTVTNKNDIYSTTAKKTYGFGGNGKTTFTLNQNSTAKPYTQTANIQHWQEKPLVFIGNELHEVVKIEYDSTQSKDSHNEYKSAYVVDESIDASYDAERLIKNDTANGNITGKVWYRKATFTDTECADFVNYNINVDSTEAVYNIGENTLKVAYPENSKGQFVIANRKDRDYCGANVTGWALYHDNYAMPVLAVKDLVITTCSIVEAINFVGIYADKDAVEIEFDKAPAVPTTEDITVTLDGNTVTGTFSVDGTKVYFKPADGIKLNKIYNIEISEEYTGTSAISKKIVVKAIVDATAENFNINNSFIANHVDDVNTKYAFNDASNTIYYALEKELTDRQQSKFGDYLVTNPNLGLADVNRYSVSFKSTVYSAMTRGNIRQQFAFLVNFTTNNEGLTSSGAGNQPFGKSSATSGINSYGFIGNRDGKFWEATPGGVFDNSKPLFTGDARKELVPLYIDAEGKVHEVVKIAQDSSDAADHGYAKSGYTGETTSVTATRFVNNDLSYTATVNYLNSEYTSSASAYTDYSIEVNDTQAVFTIGNQTQTLTYTENNGQFAIGNRSERDYYGASSSNEYSKYSEPYVSNVLAVKDLIITTCIEVVPATLENIYADSTALELEFDRNMTVPSASDVSVTLDGVAVTGNYTAEDNKVVFTPVNGFELDKNYSLVISNTYSGADEISHLFRIKSIVNTKADDFDLSKSFIVNNWGTLTDRKLPKLTFDNASDTIYYALEQDIEARQSKFGDYIVTNPKLGLADAERYSVSFKSKFHFQEVKNLSAYKQQFAFYVNVAAYGDGKVGDTSFEGFEKNSQISFYGLKGSVNNGGHMLGVFPKGTTEPVKIDFDTKTDLRYNIPVYIDDEGKVHEIVKVEADAATVLTNGGYTEASKFTNGLIYNKAYDKEATTIESKRAVSSGGAATGDVVTGKVTYLNEEYTALDTGFVDFKIAVDDEQAIYNVAGDSYIIPYIDGQINKGEFAIAGRADRDYTGIDGAYTNFHETYAPNILAVKDLVITTCVIDDADKADTVVINIIEGSNKSTGNVTVTNYYSIQKNVTLIAAAYDNEGNMTEVQVLTESLPVDAKQTTAVYSYSFTNAPAKVSVFAWDNFANAKPLAFPAKF